MPMFVAYGLMAIWPYMAIFGLYGLGLFISLKFVKSQNHPSLYSKMQNYYRFGNRWLSESESLGFFIS